MGARFLQGSGEEDGQMEEEAEGWSRNKSEFEYQELLILGEIPGVAGDAEVIREQRDSVPHL